MNKKLFHNADSWTEKKIPSSPRLTSTKSWWHFFIQKIKKKWNLGSLKKTIHLQKNIHSSKIVPFSLPKYLVSISGITVHTNVEPSVDLFLFVKEKMTLQIYLRDNEKNIFHRSSHLVFKGEQDFSILLKNDVFLHDSFFIQIKEQSGKSQSRKIALRN